MKIIMLIIVIMHVVIVGFENDNLVKAFEFLEDVLKLYNPNKLPLPE